MDHYGRTLTQLETEVGPNAIGLSGAPIIAERLSRRESEAVCRLLDNGADPDSVSGEMETLLQLAVELEMKDVAVRLLSMGVDPDRTLACHTPTPLFRAARMGSKSFVSLLVDQYGASVDAPSYANETPLMAASEWGYVTVVEMLIRAGADVNASSRSGLTALLHAGIGGHLSVAEVLLKNGANPHVRDRYGNNATDLARKRKDGMVAQGFRNLGMTDHYTLNESVSCDWTPRCTFDVFVSYKQMHFAEDADEIRQILVGLGKQVFVDRYEIDLAPNTHIDEEVLKLMLSRALQDVPLTIFFEIFWDGSHGEPRYCDTRIDWQYFELLNSQNAVLISPKRRVCEPLIMTPGRLLRLGKGFRYNNYSSLCSGLLDRYWGTT